MKSYMKYLRVLFMLRMELMYVYCSIETLFYSSDEFVLWLATVTGSYSYNYVKKFSHG